GQPGVITAVEQLERLDDELDLADAAAAELDVGGQRLAAALELPVDLLLHGADRGHDARVDAGPVDDLARPVHEARPYLGIAGRDARLQQGLALPQLGAVAVIGAVGFERVGDGAHPSLRPQPQIHAEDVALLRHRLDDGDDVAADAREVLAAGDAALGAAGGVALGAVDEHQVDVRGVVELLAAELAHADHGQARLVALGVERRAHARALRGLGHAAGLAQAHVGQPRQLLGGD